MKPSYQPLLPPGRHRFSEASLEGLTVDRFPASVRRPAIFRALTSLTRTLEGEAIPAQLWVNGSFLTEKTEPDDVDVALSVHVDDASKNMGAFNRLKMLNGQHLASELIHFFMFVRFPREDPRRSADLSAYWGQKWGAGWDGYLKGYAILEFGEAAIGRNFTP